MGAPASQARGAASGEAMAVEAKAKMAAYLANMVVGVQSFLEMGILKRVDVVVYCSSCRDGLLIVERCIDNVNVYFC